MPSNLLIKPDTGADISASSGTLRLSADGFNIPRSRARFAMLREAVLLAALKYFTARYHRGAAVNPPHVLGVQAALQR